MTYDFSDEMLDDIRRSAGIRSGDRWDFGVASIPASSCTAAATALTLQALNVNDAEIWEESALLVATTAVLSAGQVNATPEPLFDSTPKGLSWTEARKVARALRHIEVYHHQDCSLQVLADDAGMSIYRFLRLFKSLTAQTPRQYLVAMRLRAAATRLIETTDTVLEIAYDVGFGDISHFNHVFATSFSTSPTQFRRRHGEYAVRETEA